MKEKKMSSNTPYKLPLARAPLSAGPGAFADSDFEEIDANILLSGGHPTHCLLCPVTGDSCDPTIPHGSIAVVNKMIEPLNGHTIACEVDGLNHIKIFEKRESHLRLVSRNPHYEPIEVREHSSLYILGVVMFGIVVVDRVIQREAAEPIYSLTDLQPTGQMFRARFESDHGQPLEILVPRETLTNGIRMATKALKKNILRWRGK